MLKQRSRLDYSGQAGRENGRWGVEAAGLARWWIDHTAATSPVWQRLVHLLEVLGPEPEALVLAHGGLDQLGERLARLAALRPEAAIDDQLRVGCDGAERGIPLGEFELLMAEDLGRLQREHPGGWLVPDTGRVTDESGADLGPAWLSSAL